MSTVQIQQLIDQAREAAGHAYCPYSTFPVGAAAAAENGEVYPGCNVENTALGLTCCAERNALASAIARGARPGTLVRLVIYTPGERTYTPCGSCRQVMAELMPPEAEVICTSDGGETARHTVASLLPQRFEFQPPGRGT